MRFLNMALGFISSLMQILMKMRNLKNKLEF